MEFVINGIRIEVYPDPLPEGFQEWYTKTLAQCVAEGIVAKAVKRIHARDNTIGTSE